MTFAENSGQWVEQCMCEAECIAMCYLSSLGSHFSISYLNKLSPVWLLAWKENDNIPSEKKNKNYSFTRCLDYSYLLSAALSRLSIKKIKNKKEKWKGKKIKMLQSYWYFK